MSARAAWNDIDCGFPAAGSAQQKLAYVLKVVTASSPVEAWRGLQYRVAADCIELWANFESEPDDPDARESIIGCGDALFRIKLTLKWFGCLGAVELFPDLGNAELIARIHFGSGRGQDEQEFRLFKAMVGRASSAHASEHAPICAGGVKALMSTVGIEPAWLEFTEAESSRRLLLRFARAEMTSGTPVNSGQSDRWPEDNDLPTDSNQSVNLEEVAVLKTKTDDKHGWLATGKAKARVQLQARLCGVPVTVFSRAFRNKCSREQLRTAIGRKGFGQAIIGFGLGKPDLEFSSACAATPNTHLRVPAQPSLGQWLYSLLGFWIKPYQQAGNRLDGEPDALHENHSVRDNQLS